MQIAVIGAAGRTGRLVVQQALERGHQVLALARQPDAIAIREPPWKPLRWMCGTRGP
jgi:uncharacterized protein